MNFVAAPILQGQNRNKNMYGFLSSAEQLLIQNFALEQNNRQKELHI